MAPHSSTLAWKIPWMEEPGRLQSMGLRRIGHDWVTSLWLFTFMHWRRKWQPSRVLAWRIPGTGDPGGLPSMGSHRVGHDWSELAAAAVNLLLLQSWLQLNIAYIKLFFLCIKFFSNYCDFHLMIVLTDGRHLKVLSRKIVKYSEIGKKDYLVSSTPSWVTCTFHLFWIFLHLTRYRKW